jgi:acyl-CoA synthetase (AMP-forming)/AMP-acid ligase II
MVPSHTGENVLPNLPFFEKLLRYAHRSPPRIAIRDVNAGVEKTYLQLLSDAIALRKALRRALSADVLQDIDNDQDVFIALIAPGGYEYAVAFTAIIAVGAAVVPISILPYLHHEYMD